MGQKRSIVFVLCINIFPAILNFIVLRVILSNTMLFGYDIFILALGSFSFLSSLHSQLVPTLIYAFKSQVTKYTRMNISNMFKVANLIFATGLCFLVYSDINLDINVFLAVFGIMFWNHTVISLDYYLIDVNLSKNYKKGSIITLIIFTGKLTAGLISIVFFENFIYFFLIDAFVVGCLFRYRGVFKIPVFSLKKGFSLRHLLVVYSRVIYFVVLPWAFYLGSVNLPAEKASFLLGERIFLGGLGIFIAPLIPLILLSNLGNKLIITFKTYAYMVSFSVVYFPVFLLLYKSSIYPEFIDELTGISYDVFYGFILIIPLHAIIGYLSRLTLIYDKTSILSYILINLVVVLAGVILFYTGSVLYFFCITFIAQLILLFKITCSFSNESLISY